MSDPTLREQYYRANRYRAPAFIERPYIGSPGAPAQDETNASNIWAHLNAGFLMAYEYTHWWKESYALRNHAVLGDWSWLNKVRITGPDATRFMNWASCKSNAKQKVGSTLFTPMLSQRGKIAIEGLTLKLDVQEYLFTQSGAQYWLPLIAEGTDFDIELEDVTPDYSVFALQGPQSLAILEAVIGTSMSDLGFSRLRRIELFGAEVIVQRQGVTGEIGYELMMRTDTGRAHELWRLIRESGQPFGLREIGFKAQLIGHTESNMPTIIRDFLPDRFRGASKLTKFCRIFATDEDIDAIDYDLEEHLVTPSEVGWGYQVDLDHDFLGREALLEEQANGGPPRSWRGLIWNSDDVGALFADQLRDVEAPAAPDMPWGQFRVSFLRVCQDDRRVGWASALAYSPNLRRMISHARIDRHIEPGSEVRVEYKFAGDDPIRDIRAQVAEPPFIAQHRKDRLTR